MKTEVRSQKQEVRIKSRCLRLILCCFLILYSEFCILNSVYAEDEVARIQEAYKNIEDIKGAFVQQSYIKDLKRTDIYKGFLFIKRPSKMKWEYKGDQPQEVIINNDKILIHKKAEKQAFKGMFSRQTYGQAPIALLGGFGNIKEEFNVTQKQGRLILTPKRSMGNIVSIELETSEEGFPIKYFVINDTRSNRIEITLKDIKINTGIKDGMFNFSLPDGVNVYEHNP
ncbi:MAG: outer membrane lipoprotein chaperone LolA [Nitrospirae bacterium]|nr:MAG: outer membrane lipoprotein chaperone LolA [Nitrospirota bacterium]